MDDELAPADEVDAARVLAHATDRASHADFLGPPVSVRLSALEEHYALGPAMKALHVQQRDRRWRFTSQEVPRPVFGRQVYIIHLYSGHRRKEDVHAQLDFLQQGSCFAVTVLSIDLANGSCCDVLKGRCLSDLLWVIRAGVVAAFLGGPPCESWSGARALVDDAVSDRRQPRVLRFNDSPWFKADCALPELTQMGSANQLLYIAFFLFWECTLRGILAVLEHPRRPFDHHLGSIWALPYMDWMLQHTAVRTYTFNQADLAPKASSPPPFFLPMGRLWWIA